MHMAEDIVADRLNVLSQYTNQRQHIVQCNVMQEKAITNRYYGEQLQLFGSYLFG